jgi:limonene 1,2-monooxygenase
MKLKNGIFLAPFHPVDEDPTLAIQRDMELIEHLDRLGYDEAWIGEHHSAGFEIIPSPELFIAAVAERTRRIKLGTGVVSLPYHNPLMAANRIIQLDHQTKGRVMFGVGPGLLPSDAFSMGIDPSTQRDRMVEAIEVILRLWKGERVTHKTDWFTLQDATCQLLPFSDPHPEICVASSVTPSGGKLAGRHGFGMLCVAATQAGGYDALAINWEIANKTAAENGRTMDPSRLRLVGPVHIAETREKAFENVKFGLEKWQGYFSGISAVAGREATENQSAEQMVENGVAVIGTPEDAVAQIRCRKSRAISVCSCSLRTTGRISRTPRSPTRCGSAM